MPDHNLTFKPNIARISIICFSAVYVVIWSYISLVRYYSMSYHVLDLGLAATSINSLGVGPWTVTRLLDQLSNQGLNFFFYPLTFTDLIPSMLIVQSIALGLPAVLLFEISHHELKKPLISLAIGASYLLYFPLAGENWLDFHFQNFFIIFFLFGYLLFLKNRFVPASVFMILSGFVRFPYMGIVVLASLSLFLIETVTNRANHERILQGKNRWLFLILVLSSFIVVFQYFWGQTVASVGSELRFITNMNPLTNIGPKLTTFLLIFGPLLFLPLLSRKWILPMLPFFVLVLFANTPIFEYPEIFHDQYSVSVIAFVFLGLADTLTRLQTSRDSRAKMAGEGALKSTATLRVKPKYLIAAILAILVVSGIYMQPYSTVNADSFNGFDLPQNSHVNMTLFNDVKTLGNMIPQNERYVLVQNDLTQFFPRDSISRILVAPFTVGKNLTRLDILENRFPLGDSQTIRVPINYSLVNVNSGNSLMQPPNENGFETMIQVVLQMISSHCYGIVAELNGIALLKRNYTGPLISYIPLRTSIGVSSTHSPDFSYWIATSSPNVSRLPRTLWFSNKNIGLCPGDYNLTLFLGSSVAGEHNLSISVFLNDYSSPFLVQRVNTSFVSSSMDSMVQIVINFESVNFAGGIFLYIQTDNTLASFAGLNLAET